MGWKSVRDHYDIKHIVKKEADHILIGSEYIGDIMIINKDGEFIKRYDRSTNSDLTRYQSEMLADVGKLRELINQVDVFEKSIPVYTYVGYENIVILKEECEELGWPNITHSGMLMYENKFHTDIEVVREWAKKDAGHVIKNIKELISSLEKELSERKSVLISVQESLIKLSD